ncbi:uncharacterized protein LOC107619784 [Arachis ipaensis]|uniref:uncharacterized protein LOC107619784 n=1 Tax=Arachis ipaensis TaxID=130454 RepID=UPI000A2B5629|nr:uncharacterized protein LOC107619784 [Arachis ipaensis]
MLSIQKISKVKEAISIANNACWSIGELAVKIPITWHWSLSSNILQILLSDSRKKIKKSSDMNVDHLKAVRNGYSSSNSSSSIPYLANGGIPSLKLPAVVVLWLAFQLIFSSSHFYLEGKTLK